MPGFSKLIATTPPGSLAAGFDMTGLALLVLAVIGLTIIMLSTFRRTQRSRNSSGPSVKEQFAAKKNISAARKDAERVTLELDRFARHTMGQLDTRFTKLQEVIRQADERIARLEELEGSAVARPAGHAEGGKDTLGGNDGLYGPTGRMVPPSKTMPIGHVGSTIAPPVEQEASSQVKAARTVYRLADEGLALQAIAERVGRPAGEVELMLALRRVKSQSTEAASVVADSAR